MKPRPYNPLVIDPDDYDGLFDEDYLEDADDLRDEHYEPVSSGARRKKPSFDHDS